MSYRELSMTLSAEEQAQINVAQECLGRGEWKAAAREIEHMRGATRMNRDVLRLRFGICSAARDWETAFTIADAMVSWDESDAKAWVWRSEALHALKRPAEAEALLRPALQRFPGVVEIEQCLARYASAPQKRRLAS